MFDLMKLPPELRIKIYEYALVRDVIRIVCTAHPLGALHPSRNEPVQAYYESPEKTVSLRSKGIIQTNVKYTAGKVVADEISVSYGIQPDRFPPLVNIFLTSRKIYSETWPIFYEQNAFAFTIPRYTNLSAYNGLRFLYDRPYHALRHIRELHLLLGSAPQHPLRFQLACGPWRVLIDEISRHMSVRVLVLYLRGRTDDAPEYGLPDLPWREWLCTITGLQKLHLDVISTSTSEQNVALVQQLRSKMVVRGAQTGTEGFVFGRRSIPYIEWTVTNPVNSLLTTLKYPDMELNHC